jgi:hypothetical protein
LNIPFPPSGIFSLLLLSKPFHSLKIIQDEVLFPAKNRRQAASGATFSLLPIAGEEKDHLFFEPVGTEMGSI